MINYIDKKIFLLNIYIYFFLTINAFMILFDISDAKRKAAWRLDARKSHYFVIVISLSRYIN